MSKNPTATGRMTQTLVQRHEPVPGHATLDRLARAGGAAGSQSSRRGRRVRPVPHSNRQCRAKDVAGLSPVAVEDERFSCDNR